MTPPPCSADQSNDLVRRRWELDKSYRDLRYYINYPTFKNKLLALLNEKREALEAEEEAEVSQGDIDPGLKFHYF